VLWSMADFLIGIGLIWFGCLVIAILTFFLL